MALPSSGPLSISAIRNEEVNVGGFASSYSLRQLSANAGKSSPDSISEFYGYSAAGIVQSGLTWHLDASNESLATNSIWYSIQNTALYASPQTFNGGSAPVITTSGGIRYYQYTGTTAPAAAFLGGGFHVLNVTPATDYSTTSAWFNNNTSSPKVMALGSTGWENSQYQGVELYLNGLAIGYMSTRITTGANTSNSDLHSVYNYNQWYQLTQTFDGTTQKMYINGSFYTSTSKSGVQNKPNRSYAIGASYTGNGNPQIFLNAALGHYLIYNRALTDAEVLQNYNATKAKFGL
jgi:hypothetical protein